MENNVIILIDSSDEEGPPCKVRCINMKRSSTDTEKHLQYEQSPKRKIQAIDDVVIIDDQNSFENKFSAPNKEQNLIMNTQKDSIKLVKRVNLTTLKDDKLNTPITTESTNDEKHGTISCDSTSFNGDNSCIDSSSAIFKTTPASCSDELQNATSPEFEAFLNACSLCTCDIKYKTMIMKKIPSIKCKYVDADKHFVESEKFKKYLNNKTENLLLKSSNAIIIFNDVYRELESKKFRNINLTERTRQLLSKLYKTQKKVYKKVKQLENEPVDFEEDNNSSYIMLERYKERLCNIHKKICSFTKENVYSGRYLFRNLDFSHSKYSEINRAVDKLYNKKKQFPSYYEIDHCLRKCVETHHLNFTEDDLNKEIQSVFTTVGTVLQRRRKRELYDSMSYFLEGSECDPAEKDLEFNATLQNRHTENEKKIDDLLQKYSDCQERGEDPALSPDSDDSDHISNDTDVEKLE